MASGHVYDMSCHFVDLVYVKSCWATLTYNEWDDDQPSNDAHHKHEYRGHHDGDPDDDTQLLQRLGFDLVV